MKNYSSIFILFTIFNCNGWFPGFTDDQPVQSQPSQGCNKDLNLQFKNNCNQNILLYFLEINPGETVDCEKMVDYGTIPINETSGTFKIHKGKIGYFVFANDKEGKCSSQHRKSETWINCEQSNNSDVIFNICN